MSLILFDQTGSLLRTHLRCELAEPIRSSTTWSEWTTPSRRSWWVLDISDQAIDDQGLGWWATPIASDNRPRFTVANCNRRSEKYREIPLSGQCTLIGRPDLAMSIDFRRRLMGYPEGWLDLPANVLSTLSATRKSPKSSK